MEEQNPKKHQNNSNTPLTKSRITRALHRSGNRHMNVFVEANIRCITAHVGPTPPGLINVASIPNRSIQKHWFIGKPLTLVPLGSPHHLPINQPLDQIWTPLDHVLMKSFRTIEPQIMNLLSIPGSYNTNIYIE